MSLPRGATVVDFAYMIHSNLGDHLVAAKINSQQVPLRTELKNGDVVEVMTAPVSAPNPSWLGFVRTGRARSRIRHHLKTMAHSESMDLGLKLLTQALRAEGIEKMPDDPSRYQGLWDKVLRFTGNRNRSDLLVDVGLGKRIASIVAKRMAALLSEMGEKPDPLLMTRERFMANFQPMKVSCDLSVAGLHNSSTRFSFQAVVLIVYPATMKPERRHLLLIDSRGCTGITVWNENVSLFSADSVGQVVKFTKLSLTSQNGQKSLSMSRDSTVNFVSTAAAACEESKWWSSLLDKRPLRIIDVHDQDENSIISVSGIVGTLSSEIKKVKNEEKVLMCMRITDRTGFVDVRSWNHSECEFDSFREKPILLKRVRVTAYAGSKMIELLDASGTQVLSVFDGAPDLVSYWSE
jgi:sulfur carrier protein ThiS